MRTLRSVLQTLTTLPRGFSADGRSLGLGLAAAMQAQADGRTPTRTEPPVEPAVRLDDDQLVEAR